VFVLLRVFKTGAASAPVKQNNASVNIQQILITPAV
jgi:hypothetical protein